MGMVGGLGQTGGATGVGSATTQTGNQQLAAPTGGKGGSIPQGMQQPMQRIMQPQQFQQPYRPFGGDVYGYNMNRLARQMAPPLRCHNKTFPQLPTPNRGLLMMGMDMVLRKWVARVAVACMATVPRSFFRRLMLPIRSNRSRTTNNRTTNNLNIRYNLFIPLLYPVRFQHLHLRMTILHYGSKSQNFKTS